MTAATAAIYPLKSLAPVVSLSVVYLPAVLLVSAYWGLVPGLVTSLLSAAAFNFFQLPPIGRFTLADSRNWVALAAFVTVAAVVSAMAELARTRAFEAERRRREADLAAALARELLAGTETGDALGASARRLAQALAISSAAIEVGAADGDERRKAMALTGADGRQIATLLVPRGLPPETAQRLSTRVVPALEALVAIALRRDALLAEAVETEALRRSDDVKTALLRTVSHDLRTPLTAIVAAGHALGTSSLAGEERIELSAGVVDEGDRLSRLVDKLLDLSVLQAGARAAATRLGIARGRPDRSTRGAQGPQRRRSTVDRHRPAPRAGRRRAARASLRQGGDASALRPARRDGHQNGHDHGRQPPHGGQDRRGVGRG